MISFLTIGLKYMEEADDFSGTCMEGMEKDFQQKAKETASTMMERDGCDGKLPISVMQGFVVLVLNMPSGPEALAAFRSKISEMEQQRGTSRVILRPEFSKPDPDPNRGDLELS